MSQLADVNIQSSVGMFTHYDVLHDNNCYIDVVMTIDPDQWLNSAGTAFHNLCLAFHHLKLPFHHIKLSLHHLAMPFRHHNKVHTSDVRIVFFHFELNRIVIVGLRSHQ